MADMQRQLRAVQHLYDQVMDSIREAFERILPEKSGFEL